MKRFADYTDVELLTIDNEELNSAIRIEAIQRGITPPITLSEALRNSEWRGYQKPSAALKVYEIMHPTPYGSQSASGCGFLDEESALRAIEGMVAIETEGYGEKKSKLITGTFTVAARFIGIETHQQKWSKFEEFTQDNTEFQKVVDECLERHSKARQDDYNKRVLNEKKAEYLRLASGNLEIAKAFWAKTGNSVWPE